MATLVVDETIEKPRPRGVDLPCEDGEPLESGWHRAAMTLLIEMLQHHFRGRTDRYVDGNLLVYFDEEQEKKHHFRGPDFFVVKGAHGNHIRESWVIWEERGVRPAYVIELASKTTKSFDIGSKKDIYEQQLKTPEYVVYDYRDEELRGWRLDDHGEYQELTPDARGWLWSEQLNLWLGVDDCLSTDDQTLRAPRFFDRQGQRLPTKAERIAAATQRVKAEAERADAAEAEIARLKAELAKKA